MNQGHERPVLRSAVATVQLYGCVELLKGCLEAAGAIERIAQRMPVGAFAGITRYCTFQRLDQLLVIRQGVRGQGTGLACEAGICVAPDLAEVLAHSGTGGAIATPVAGGQERLRAVLPHHSLGLAELNGLCEIRGRFVPLTQVGKGKTTVAPECR